MKNNINKIFLILILILFIDVVSGEEYNYDFSFNSTPYSINKTLNLIYTQNYTNTNLTIIINTTSKYINLTNITLINISNVSLYINIFINETINGSDTTYIYYYYNSTLDYIDILNFNLKYIVTPPPPQADFIIIGDNEFLLKINQSILPFHREYGHMIEAPANSNISIICGGFLECDDYYMNGGATLFNFTFNISIPAYALGYYVDYLILFIDNKIKKIIWNFNITSEESIYGYTVTEEDIAVCMTTRKLSMINCINILVNKSSVTIINRTIYRNRSVEVPVPVIRWDYDTIEKLFNEKNKTDAALRAVGNKDIEIGRLNDRLIKVESDSSLYIQTMLDLNEQRLLERSEYDKRINRSDKRFIRIGIYIIISIITYFLLNYIYKIKTSSTHSLAYEIYYNLKRVV